MKKIFKLSTEISEMSILTQKKSRGGSGERSYSLSEVVISNDWHGSGPDWNFPTVPDDYSNSGVFGGGSNSGVETYNPDPEDNVNDPNGVLEATKTKMTENIEALKQALNSNLLSGKDIQDAQEVIDAYQQTKDNIELIQNSENKYRIDVIADFDNDATKANAEFYYDKDTGEFVILVESTNAEYLPLFAHELEHANQLENGELYIDNDGNIKGYDINDEVDAYDVQHKLNFGVGFDSNDLSGNPVNNPYEVTPDEIYNNFPNIYDHLKLDSSGESGSTSATSSSSN